MVGKGGGVGREVAVRMGLAVAGRSVGAGWSVAVGVGEVGRYVGSGVGIEEGVRGGAEVDVQAGTKAKKTAASVRTTAIFKGCSRQVGANGIPSSSTDTTGEGSRCGDFALLVG